MLAEKHSRCADHADARHGHFDEAESGSSPFRPSIQGGCERGTATGPRDPLRGSAHTVQSGRSEPGPSKARIEPGQHRRPAGRDRGCHSQVIVVDANLLLYAYNKDAERHEASRVWLEESLASGQLVRFAWLTLWAFIRISTNRRVFELLETGRATTASGPTGGGGTGCRWRRPLPHRDPWGTCRASPLARRCRALRPFRTSR